MPAKTNIPGARLTQAGKPAAYNRRNTMAKRRGGRNNQESLASKGPERSGAYGPRTVKSSGMPTQKPKPGHVWARLKPGVWTQSNTSRPVSARNPKPRPQYAPKAGYQWVRKNGRWYQVRQGASKKPGKGGKNVISQTGGGRGKNRNNRIDPRDAQFREDMARLNMERQNQMSGIKRQLMEAKPLYQRGFSDLMNSYNESRYGSNADLASRGIFNSGERMKRGVEMQDTLGRGQLDLSNQYGEGFVRDMADRQAQLQRQFQLERQGLFNQAKDRYRNRYPASRYVFNTLGNTKNG